MSALVRFEIWNACGNPEEIAKKARVGFTMRAYDHACLRLRQGVYVILVTMRGYVYRRAVISTSGVLQEKRF